MSLRPVLNKPNGPINRTVKRQGNQRSVVLALSCARVNFPSGFPPDASIIVQFFEFLHTFRTADPSDKPGIENFVQKIINVTVELKNVLVQTGVISYR